jgi:PKD repeat protein
MRDRVRLLLLGGLVGLLVLSSLLASLPVQAQGRTGQGERWLSFGGEISQPELLLLRSSSSQLDLQASAPGVWADDIQEKGVLFTRLYGEGYASSSEVGMPALPVIRREVKIPAGAEASLQLIDARYVDVSLASRDLSPIYPLQPPLVKLPGAEEASSFVIDEAFYERGDLYPAQPLSLGDAYTMRGHRILPVEIWPAAYNPSSQTLRIYSEVTFRLNFTRGEVSQSAFQERRLASPVFDEVLADTVLNYNLGRPGAQANQTGYLIITADAFYAGIQPFAQLQQGRGFAVTTTKLSDIPGGASTTAVKAYIQTAYDTWPIPPSYVLLVGDQDTIPVWVSTTSTSNRTDLYYATMDGSADYVPDIGLGRFPVRSTVQLQAMVNKYLAYFELTGQEPWLKKAGFIATCDRYLVAEGTHNYVINTYTLPDGYTGIFPSNPQPGGDKIYCITHGGSAVNITNAANEGRWALVYSGHGSSTGWADGAVSFSQTQVRSLSSSGFFPFVASHACVTAAYSVDESFADTWVIQENKGALVFWGASHNTYWDEDDILEKRMWDKLFEAASPSATVAAMTHYGLSQTANMYPASAKYYWEAYQVMGDPSVRIFREPERPSFTVGVEPSRHEVCSTGEMASTVTISSLLGYDGMVYLEHGTLPHGAAVSFEPASASAPFSSSMGITVDESAQAGDYVLPFTATDYGDFTFNKSVDLRIAGDAPQAAALLSPPDGAANQIFTPLLDWSPTDLTSSYRLQVDRTPLFSQPLLDESVAGMSSYILPYPLDGGRCYYWRVQGENACGEGQWSLPYSFATVALGLGFHDMMEAGEVKWLHSAAVGIDQWAISGDQSYSPSHAWFAPDPNSITDTRLRLKDSVPVGAGSTLTFWHRFQFEANYDGSVLEISTNGGASWTDLGPFITANGYNGTLSSGFSNPLGGRQAWTGTQNEWKQVPVDLSSFAGQSVLIRWRLGADSSISAQGWYIDDVEITSPLPAQDPPLLLSVSPASASVFTQTTILVEGANFFDVPSLRLGETWLETNLLSPTQLEAVVPAGMPEGTYDLTLISGDCQTAVLAQALELTAAPLGSFTTNSPVTWGEPLLVTATLQSLSPVSYAWDFGGVGQAQGEDGPTPSFLFEGAGTFTVTLTASNESGARFFTRTVLVEGMPPHGSFTAPDMAYMGEMVHFTAEMLGPLPISCLWDFGGPGTGYDIHTMTPAYVYSAAGVYTVKLIVDNDFGVYVVERQIEISGAAPTGGFTVLGTLAAGQPLTFQAEFSGIPPLSFAWDFGGPGSGSGLDTPQPVYAYTQDGAYTIHLTVTDGIGQITVVQKDILIGSPLRQLFLPLLIHPAPTR